MKLKCLHLPGYLLWSRLAIKSSDFIIIYRYYIMDIEDLIRRGMWVRSMNGIKSIRQSLKPIDLRVKTLYPYAYKPY